MSFKHAHTHNTYTHRYLTPYMMIDMSFYWTLYILFPSTVFFTLFWMSVPFLVVLAGLEAMWLGRWLEHRYGKKAN